MIEPDINERMARFAPSQNVGSEPDPIALEVLAETEADAPPPMAPGFDPIAVQIARESQEEMMATLRGASAVNPDQAARAQRIGQQVGIGQDVVLRNMAEMEREVVARQAIDRDLMRTAPNLARFLGQREFATIAHDDIDNLTKAERVFKWFAGIPKDVEEGLSRAVATAELGKMYEAQMRGVEPTWLDRVVIQSYNDELGRLSKESGFIESAANIVGIQAEMAAQVPEQVLMGTVMGGAAGLVGGPFAPATVPAGMAIGATAGLTVGMGRAAYILEAGNAYGSMVEEADTVLRQRRDAGEIDAATYESDMSEVRDRARNIATGVGVVNAGLELVGLKMIAAPFREAFKGAVRRATAQAVTQQTTRAALGRAGTQYGLAIAGETGTEVMQEIVTVAGEELNSYGADLPLKMSTEEGRAEVAQRLVDTAIDTAKGMTLVGLPGPVVNYYVNTRKVAEARKAERFFTDLADVSKQDKVAERSPAAYERFLAAQAEGTQAETIYVDARTMQSVLQQAQRADPALTDEVIDEAMPGVRQELEKQLETGGDVTIPTATFGARLARTDLGRSLIPHMRLNPDALSVDEAVRYRGQMEERRQEAMRLMQEQDAAGTSFSQEAETVRDDVRARLEAAGRSREEADVGSLLYRDFVVTNAARMGMTPAQFQAERGLREIVGAEVGVAPLEQAATIDAEYMAAVERGDMETAQRMVDEAAKAAGYSQKKYYHASSNFRLADIRNNVFYVAETEADARKAADAIYRGGTPLKIYEVYIPADTAITDTAAQSSFLNRAGALETYADLQAIRGQMAGGDISEIAIINPTGKIKSAEPVTRDADGNVIPLSRRFNLASPRIFEQAAAGPARGGFDPKRLTVLLNKQADLSTFLHELSHYFLTTYSDIAASGKASPELLADLDTTLQWFGIAGDTPQARLAAWNSMSLDQQRPFHEQFAYSFEVYAFDGKAPSAELRGVFERFSSYLKRVYKSIRDELNAIYRREFGKDLPLLTPEVRQVFDRMLASESAIRRQQAIDGIKPAFLTREQAGVDEAQWAEHQAALADAEAIAINDMTKASLRTVQWMSNARSRIVKEMQSKHDAKRKDVRDEVAAQVRMEPAYRAQAYLRYGKFIDADGQEVAVEGTHKLDLDTVKQMYELEPEALRPDVTAMARGKYGFVGKDGLNPDMIAETFGYSSGDQMIRAVVDLKPIKEAIDERTDAVMVERFSDLNSKAAVDAEVQKSLHNEARARFVAIELKFAAKATEPTRVIVEAARQAARDIIAAKKVRDVRPSEHVAAEARASKDAVMLAGKTEIPDSLKVRYPTGTVNEALIRAKRQEMYQNQLAEEALRVKDEVDKDVKYLRRVLRDENVKRMGADATDQVAELLSRFDVAAVPLKILDRRKQTLSAWMEAKADGGIVPDIAPELLEAGRRVNYREMTVAEFRDLVSAVKQIEYVGKNERKLQLAEERAEFEEKRDEIVTRIRATGRLRGLDIDPRSPLTNIGRTVSKLQAFAAAHLKAASIARVLDGGKDDGPLWNTVIRTANAAADMETRMRSEATAKLAEILKPVFALGNMGGKGMFFRSINRSLNREARIAIALNMGNAGNMQRLLDGEGWNMAQVQPVLESLTAAEWNAVQQVWDFLETYRPLVAAKERRLYGKEPNWVEPQPLTVRTSDGQTLTLRGGYYPVKYDPVASDRVATFDEVQEAKDALRGTYTAATTRRSFTKARAEKVVGRPILYTLDAAFSGVNDVIHDLAWHEWLISTNRLLRDEKFANAIRETRGPEFLRQLREWAKANAAGDRSANVEGVLSWLRQGISASGLGFNVMSAALQITGFNQSVVRVGAKWVGLGIAEFTASPLATSQFVREKSSFMAERQRTQFRELNELRNTVRGKGAGVRKVLAQAYLAMMTMQRAVDTPTWVGAYRKALAAGKDDATSVALADQAVKDSQGSGLTSDLAAIERGGPGLKLFTVFYSYMNTVYNMAAVQTYTSRGRGKLAADYVMLMVVPVVLGHAIKSLLTPDAGDDDFDPEALARKLAAEELSFLMGTMVVAREFGGAAQLLTGAEGARMGYGGPAGVRAIGEAYNLATQTGQMEFDRAFVRSAINTLGAFTGLPSAQINRTIDGVQAILEGEVEGVGAVVAPLTGVKK